MKKTILFIAAIIIFCIVPITTSQAGNTVVIEAPTVVQSVINHDITVELNSPVYNDTIPDDGTCNQRAITIARGGRSGGMHHPRHDDADVIVIDDDDYYEDEEEDTEEDTEEDEEENWDKNDTDF